jgi:pimeloyl-ACP methyl ester carboxylesterase
MSTDAAQLRIETAGDPTRPAVVLSHGTMDRSAGMLRLSRRLDDDFFVVRYDRRGYGRSIGVGPPFTMEAHVDDLRNVITDTLVDRSAAAVFGHSFGGNVALGLAMSAPELVDRVVVYETPLSWFDWWPGNTAGGVALGDRAAADTDPEDAAEIFMRRLVGDAIWERLPSSTRSARRAEGPAMVAELTDLRRVAPWNAEQISQPVLAIGGETGRPHHQRGMRALAAMIDGAEHVELAGAGHGAPNTHPDELAAIVAAFVSRPCG